MKQHDNQDKTALENRWEHRARLSAEYAGSSFGSRTQLDGGYCANDAEEWGVMLSQNLSYTHRWLRLNAGLGYFHTTSYDSRVYLYEQSPLYTYAMTQFYGEGIRYWLMARANIGHHLMLTAKCGITGCLLTVGSRCASQVEVLIIPYLIIAGRACRLGLRRRYPGSGGCIRVSVGCAGHDLGLP